MTGWCESDSGVRQGWPLSPLLINIYVRELDMNVARCKHGFKYLRWWTGLDLLWRKVILVFCIHMMYV